VPFFVSAEPHEGVLGCDEVELGSGEKGEQGGEFHRNRGKCLRGGVSGGGVIRGGGMIYVLMKVLGILS